MTSASQGSLHDFVSTVVALARGDFPSEPMTRLLTEARVRGEDLAPYVVLGGGSEYARALIHRTDEVEILAMTWPKGSATPIHDHAGQRCWMVATSGMFFVEDYRQIAGVREPGYAVVEKLGAAWRMPVGLPDFRSERERDIHRVLVAPDCELAVSLHVYARPYTTCLVFDEAERRARELHLAVHPAPF